ncbi:MAG: hypothetical protein PUB54_08500 [Lachnospiraceae bacterium]|nr:hypothetical protein [Lachnospiraceae bacterium]
MISQIIATQNSGSIATIQQNASLHSMALNHNAHEQVREEERQIRESVVQKDEAVFYEQHHDAKEEGKNKYSNLYSNNKKKKASGKEQASDGIHRVNFDIKI